MNCGQGPEGTGIHSFLEALKEIGLYLVKTVDLDSKKGRAVVSWTPRQQWLLAPNNTKMARAVTLESRLPWAFPTPPACIPNDTPHVTSCLPHLTLLEPGLSLCSEK